MWRIVSYQAWFCQYFPVTPKIGILCVLRAFVVIKVPKAIFTTETRSYTEKPVGRELRTLPSSPFRIATQFKVSFEVC